jgi:hypothetical protein
MELQMAPFSPPVDEVLAWLETSGHKAAASEPLPGDVSARRYARLALADGTTAILATYPSEVRSVCPRFLATTGLLTSIGVRVPRVLAANCEQGYMLLEDLGTLTFADWAIATHRPWSELTAYFEEALAQARRIAALPPSRIDGLSPLLGRELLEKELRQTWDLFLVPQGLTGEGEEETALTDLLAEICSRLAEEPAVPCHRDFMARNLMPLHDEDRPTLAVLDHQDLRLGPPAYDLASLLNDTLFPTPEVEESLLSEWASTAEERLSYHRAAAQRTLKAVGTYAAFARRGAERHLPLIPRTLGRCLGHLGHLPEAEALLPSLSHRWRPALEPSGH